MTKSQYPPAVLEAAAQAIAARFDTWTTREASDVIFTVLDAAAPHIVAAERERIAQLAEKYDVRYGRHVAIDGTQTSRLPSFADLIRGKP